MKPVEFKEHNVVYAKDQKQYIPLPGLRKGQYDINPEGAFVTCWKPSLKDRLRILFGGNFWLETLTFWHNLQPVRISTRKKDLVPGYFKRPDDASDAKRYIKLEKNAKN